MLILEQNVIPGAVTVPEVIIKVSGTEETVAVLRSTAWPNLQTGDRFLLWDATIGGETYYQVECEVAHVSFQYSWKNPMSPLFMVLYLRVKETVKTRPQ